MIRPILILAAALTLSACSTMNAANEAGGVVDTWSGNKAALKKADALCSRYNKVASITATDVWAVDMTFVCIDPNPTSVAAK